VTLPKDYLKEGYWVSGNPNPRLVTTDADIMAKELLRARISMGQLAKPYRYLKAQEGRLKSGVDYASMELAIHRVGVQARTAVARDIAPPVLAEFIERNLDLVTNAKDLRHCFLPHYEAVLSYFMYLDKHGKR